MSIEIAVLEDGTSMLVADKPFNIMSMTKDGDTQPTMYGLVITQEVKDFLKSLASEKSVPPPMVSHCIPLAHKDRCWS
jgi:hypothetical protein